MNVVEGIEEPMSAPAVAASPQLLLPELPTTSPLDGQAQAPAADTPTLPPPPAADAVAVSPQQYPLKDETPVVGQSVEYAAPPAIPQVPASPSVGNEGVQPLRNELPAQGSASGSPVGAPEVPTALPEIFKFTDGALMSSLEQPAAQPPTQPAVQHASNGQGSSQAGSQQQGEMKGEDTTLEVTSQLLELLLSTTNDSSISIEDLPTDPNELMSFVTEFLAQVNNGEAGGNAAHTESQQSTGGNNANNANTDPLNNILLSSTGKEGNGNTSQAPFGTLPNGFPAIPGFDHQPEFTASVAASLANAANLGSLGNFYPATSGYSEGSFSFQNRQQNNQDPNAKKLERQKVREENRERKKRWRECNQDRNKDNDLRCRVTKRANKLFGTGASKEKEQWMADEFNKRRAKREAKEKARSQEMPYHNGGGMHMNDRDRDNSPESTPEPDNPPAINKTLLSAIQQLAHIVSTNGDQPLTLVELVQLILNEPALLTMFTGLVSNLSSSQAMQSASTSPEPPSVRPNFKSHSPAPEARAPPSPKEPQTITMPANTQNDNSTTENHTPVMSKPAPEHVDLTNSPVLGPARDDNRPVPEHVDLTGSPAPEPQRVDLTEEPAQVPVQESLQVNASPTHGNATIDSKSEPQQTTDTSISESTQHHSLPSSEAMEILVSPVVPKADAENAVVSVTTDNDNQASLVAETVQKQDTLPMSSPTKNNIAIMEAHGTPEAPATVVEPVNSVLAADQPTTNTTDTLVPKTENAVGEASSNAMDFDLSNFEGMDAAGLEDAMQLLQSGDENLIGEFMKMFESNGPEVQESSVQETAVVSAAQDVPSAAPDFMMEIDPPASEVKVTETESSPDIVMQDAPDHTPTAPEATMGEPEAVTEAVTEVSRTTEVSMNAIAAEEEPKAAPQQVPSVDSTSQPALDSSFSLPETSQAPSASPTVQPETPQVAIEKAQDSTESQSQPPVEASPPAQGTATSDAPQVDANAEASALANLELSMDPGINDLLAGMSSEELETTLKGLDLHLDLPEFNFSDLSDLHAPNPTPAETDIDMSTLQGLDIESLDSIMEELKASTEGLNVDLNVDLTTDASQASKTESSFNTQVETSLNEEGTNDDDSKNVAPKNEVTSNEPIKNEADNKATEAASTESQTIGGINISDLEELAEGMSAEELAELMMAEGINEDDIQALLKEAGAMAENAPDVGNAVSNASDMTHIGSSKGFTPQGNQNATPSNQNFSTFQQNQGQTNGSLAQQQPQQQQQFQSQPQRQTGPPPQSQPQSLILPQAPPQLQQQRQQFQPIPPPPFPMHQPGLNPFAMGNNLSGLNMLPRVDSHAQSHTQQALRQLLEALESGAVGQDLTQAQTQMILNQRKRSIEASAPMSMAKRQSLDSSNFNAPRTAFNVPAPPPYSKTNTSKNNSAYVASFGNSATMNQKFMSPSYRPPSVAYSYANQQPQKPKRDESKVKAMGFPPMLAGIKRT